MMNQQTVSNILNYGSATGYWKCSDVLCVFIGQKHKSKKMIKPWPPWPTNPANKTFKQHLTLAKTSDDVILN